MTSDQDSESNLNSNGDDGTGDESMGAFLTRSLVKGLLFSAILAVIAIVAYLSPLQIYFNKIMELAKGLSAMGTVGAAIYALAAAILIFLGAPRLLLCPLGGMAFGFGAGLLLNQTGTLLAYCATFALARWAGRETVERLFPKLRGFGGLLRSGGVPGVILARQLPMHGLLINVALALSPVKIRHFVVGTIVGTLPAAVPCTLVGSGVDPEGAGVGTVGLAGALILLAVFWAILRIRRKSKKKPNPLSDSN